jgi:uncharacterized membrane protein SirB2
MDNKRNKKIYSFAGAAIIAIVFVGVATILAELYKPFKDWLAETFYHHWMGKGIIMIVIFYLLGFIGFRASGEEDKMISMSRILFWTALIWILAITGFYLYEYIIHA